jgi:hypothetical protein
MLDWLIPRRPYIRVAIDLKANEPGATRIFEITFGIFSKDFAKWGLFSKYVEKVPLAPPSAAPPRPEEGVFFQNIWKLYPIFFLKTCQI